MGFGVWGLVHYGKSRHFRGRPPEARRPGPLRGRLHIHTADNTTTTTTTNDNNNDMNTNANATTTTTTTTTTANKIIMIIMIIPMLLIIVIIRPGPLRGRLQDRLHPSHVRRSRRSGHRGQSYVYIYI